MSAITSIRKPVVSFVSHHLWMTESLKSWNCISVYLIYFLIRLINNLIETLVVKDLETLAGLQAKDESVFHNHIVIVILVIDNKIQFCTTKCVECDFLGGAGWSFCESMNSVGNFWDVNKVSPQIVFPLTAKHYVCPYRGILKKSHLKEWKSIENIVLVSPLISLLCFLLSLDLFLDCSLWFPLFLCCKDRCSYAIFKHSLQTTHSPPGLV